MSRAFSLVVSRRLFCYKNFHWFLEEYSKICFAISVLIGWCSTHLPSCPKYYEYFLMHFCAFLQYLQGLHSCFEKVLMSYYDNCRHQKGFLERGSYLQEGKFLMGKILTSSPSFETG